MQRLYAGHRGDDDSWNDEPDKEAEDYYAPPPARQNYGGDFFFDEDDEEEEKDTDTDDDYSDAYSSAATSVFTGPGDVLLPNVDIEDGLCGDDDDQVPSLLTMELPAGQPLAFYAQVEAFHRRAILPHLQIQVAAAAEEEEAIPAAGPPAVSGGGGLQSGLQSGLRRIGLYDSFKDKIEQTGVREGALMRWLPPAPREVPEMEEDVGSDDMDFSPEDDTLLMHRNQEGYLDDDDAAAQEEIAILPPPPPMSRAELIARLPGTSVAYWAASAPGAWMF